MWQKKEKQKKLNKKCLNNKISFHSKMSIHVMVIILSFSILTKKKIS